MKTSELKKLIEGNFVNRIVLRLSAKSLKPAKIWEVFCYDVPDNDICKNFGELLVNNDGTPKTYTSLDRANVSIRAWGFQSNIEIEE